MDDMLLLNRWIHIGAGFVGFFMAPAALAVRKGGAAHRLWGRIFFWSMVVAGITAIFSASVKGLTFLLLTGIFSLYLAWFGYRSLYHKHMGQGQQAAVYDWVGVGLGLVVFGGTIIYGVVTRNIISVVFGGIGANFAIQQLRAFRRPGPWPAGQWLHNHISGFVGAYIAAVSAFSATSLSFIPWPWNFLWPTLVMVPPLIWVQRRYKAKFSQGQRPEEVVEVRLQKQMPA
ncbi:hypothetical protein GCM10011375_15350 [Hymenobacter qilianensis]|uniref:DUF2306 domain-containing protein n=2 Tax=Hymenobacter qilianensis TaxID=1385715 RepID=A0A7H0GXE2_9BACT|nr:hypothetical protein [Hymenobacter qilianensis]QNP52958.1 hypothetical protein H9L05_04470 [Hymenobacter qilianensis]GGF61132.1 hypothetical protein GCM10011375_15350 [Hymenobacter qilianensis]